MAVEGAKISLKYKSYHDAKFVAPNVIRMTTFGATSYCRVDIMTFKDICLQEQFCFLVNLSQLLALVSLKMKAVFTLWAYDGKHQGCIANEDKWQWWYNVVVTWDKVSCFMFCSNYTFTKPVNWARPHMICTYYWCGNFKKSIFNIYPAACQHLSTFPHK